MRERVTVFTLSVCHSLCVSLFHSGEGAVFRVETYICNSIGDFKCSTFLKIEAILEKKRVELRNCDVRRHRPVIKRFSTWSFSTWNHWLQVSRTFPSRTFVFYAIGLVNPSINLRANKWCRSRSWSSAWAERKLRRHSETPASPVIQILLSYIHSH